MIPLAPEFLKVARDGRFSEVFAKAELVRDRFLVLATLLENQKEIASRDGRLGRILHELLVC